MSEILPCISDLNFKAAAIIIKCAHCGKTKGRHEAITFNCPDGRLSFPNFSKTNFYTPSKNRRDDL